MPSSRNIAYGRVVSSFVVLVSLFIPLPARAQSGWKDRFVASLKNGGALAVDGSGRVILDHRASESFIPASTVKVATSFAALQLLGEDFRFRTEFFRDGDTLYMKGYGDPFLVSEEFPLVVAGLQKSGFAGAARMVCDPSYFAADVAVDGASRSANPYDALNGALIANFNTVAVRRVSGRIVSAEPQTPLTPLAEAAARRMGVGRVNLGKDADTGARYAGEILVAFLEKEGVRVSGPVAVGRVPPGLKAFYTHVSSKTLADNVRGLLEFSTNFIANQLFLVMGAEKSGAPATVEKAQKTLRDFLTNEVGWKNFELMEGAGLSRMNRVSPEQMVRLLELFAPYRDLLPLKEEVLRAKTGTLNGVNTLVGYFPDKNGGLVRFAILVNAAVPGDYKYTLGKMLYRGVNGGM